MATARAIASGNWSAPSTWNGGVLPGNGDTVYANGFTVTIDQNITIGDTNNPIVNAGSFVSGQYYRITSVGTTSFPGAGSNNVGLIFLATGVGSGTGQARALATLTTLSNTAAGATSGGGGFTMSVPYDVNADIRGGTSSCLTISATTGTINMNGSIIVAQGAGNNQHGLVLSSSASASINLTGFSINGISATSYPIVNFGAGTINVNNAIIIGGANLGADTAYGILNNAAGAINVSNSTLSGNTTAAGQGPAIYNNASGTVTITTSTITGTTTKGTGVFNNAGGVFTVTNSTLSAGSVAALVNNATGTIICSGCTFTASATSSAVSSISASADVRLSGSFYDAANGYRAVHSPKWRMAVAPTAAIQRMALDGLATYVNFFTADNSLGQANPTDVRSGVSYASGNLTGRLTVPARGSVALSVNYGPSMPFTATVSGTTATATLAYSYPLVVGDSITVTGASNSEWNSTYTIASVVSGTSVTFVVPATHRATAGTGALMQTTGTAVLDPAAVASAVWGAASRTITGGLVDTATTLTNAPTVPTPVEIRAEMDSNSTKLANLDATVSSRLASSAYSAAPTTAQIATAVEGSLLNEADGQAVLNALVSAIGNQNLSEVSLVAAVRADLERTGGKLDNIPTTSAPSASAVAGAVRTELGVELGRLDASVSSRLAPSGTLATVTNLTNAPASVTPSDIWSHSSRTLTSASGPTAAEIRQEMDSSSSKLANLDAAISSRMAASESSKLDAVKAKTDALNTERLANVPTVNILGTLLAQANS
jgi:hypothetical protein